MQGHNGQAQIKGDNLSTYDGLELIITDDCIKYYNILSSSFSNITKNDIFKDIA
jgi:hypothetical protein